MINELQPRKEYQPENEYQPRKEPHRSKDLQPSQELQLNNIPYSKQVGMRPPGPSPATATKTLSK